MGLGCALRMNDERRDSRSFRTDAVSGGRWGAIRSVILQVTSVLTTAVLARLLSSSEFGLVAITVVVLLMFDLITRVGLGASIIRRDPLTREFASTFFWASVALGVAAGGLAALISAPAATLAGSVEAAPLVALAAVTLPLNLATRVPSAMLAREFRFRTSAAIEVVGSVIHGVVAISLAFAGLGALAVVIGQIARSTAMLVGSMAKSGFRPEFLFKRHHIVEELSFSLSWLTGDLIGYSNKNADYWFVGNRLGTSALGVYYVAYVIPNLLRRRINAIGHNVIYPIVSRISDDMARIAAAYLEIVRLVSFLVVPAMLGVAVLADLVVAIGFGPEWADAVAPLRVIAVAAAITSIVVVGVPIFPALGRPQILILTGLVGLVTLVVGLAFFFDDGTLVTVALAVLVAAIVEGSIVIWKLRSVVGVQVRAFFAAVAPFVISAILMAGSIVILRSSVFDSLGHVTEGILCVVTGAILYMAIGGVVFRGAFREQLGLVKTLVLPRSGS